ncbi:hypothetical protein LBMAG56_25620 [Verrucomicrobiota bacterium]|nr:hypothetical protein LBMAG56_25620 [Verrucomicrobiota bacterium]
MRTVTRLVWPASNMAGAVWDAKAALSPAGGAPASGRVCAMATITKVTTASRERRNGFTTGKVLREDFRLGNRLRPDLAVGGGF